MDCSSLAPLSMGFSKQENWKGLPYLTPGDLPGSGIKSTSPALAGEFFTTEPPGNPKEALPDPVTPQRAVCRTASWAEVRGNEVKQSIHSGVGRGAGTWGDTHAFLSRADGILGISPSLPTGSLALQGSSSLGTLRQAVTLFLSTLSTSAATPIPSHGHI